jgi:hypothetical protein
MNKTEVCCRPGWTAGRVAKFLTIEHVHVRHGYYGDFQEYEYSLPQVLEAEESPEWRQAAAKYLSVPIDDLEARLAELATSREVAWIEIEAERGVSKEKSKARLEAQRAEFEALIASVRGGLCRIGCSHPLSDGWRTFEIVEVMEYVDFVDRRGRIDGDYVREFYRLWSAGAGYCNRKGVLRRIIAPVKKRLIRILLHLARCRKWAYGAGSDGKQNKVLYIETPFGQVSFHLMPYEGKEYPKYTGSWSGLHNSDQILIQLFDTTHAAQARIHLANLAPLSSYTSVTSMCND